MRRRIVLVLVLSSCQRVSWFNRATDKPDPGYPAEDTSECPPDSMVTWRNHAKPLIDTWCTNCHSTLLSGGDRQGAPDGLNFDSYLGVYAYRDRIRLLATGDDPFMPPAGGIPDIDRERLREWIDCGAKGEADDPGLCGVTNPQAGSLTVAGQGDADALCNAGFNAIEGDLVVTGGDVLIDCLCEVGGDLRVEASTATSLSITELLSVGGELVISDNSALAIVELPEITVIGWNGEPGNAGGLTLSGNSALTEVDWPWLRNVGGAYLVTDNTGLSSLMTSHAEWVNGPFAVTDNPLLETLNWERLRLIEGEFTLEDNALLFDISTTAAVERIGGKLSVQNNPALLEVGGFISVDEQLGDVEIAFNDALITVDGFTALYEMTGQISIHDNPSLLDIAGFQHLEEIHGDILIEDNPLLEEVKDAFVNLAILDGELSFDNDVALNDIDGFEVITDLGSLTLRDLPALVDAAPLDTVTAVNGPVVVRNTGIAYLQVLENALNIAGHVRITENADLVAVQGFATVTAIDGDVKVADNPVLVALPTFDLLTDVDGDFALQDNPLLEEPHGVDVLTNIGGDLLITDNVTLFTVDQLTTVVSVIGDVEITGNAALPAADADALANGIGSVGGTITVSGNGP